MAIAARCSTCGKSYQLADEQAGLRVRCRECKNEFEVAHPPDVLEAVAARPRPERRRYEEREDRPVPEVRQGSSNKPLFWVLGLLGGGILALILVCGGVVWMLTMQVQKAAVQVTQEVKEIQKQAEPVPPPKVVVQEKVEVKELPKIEIAPEPKDLDDALLKLRSADWRERLGAVAWLGKQKPPADAAKRKKIFAAIEERLMDENATVKVAAASAWIVWFDE